LADVSRRQAIAAGKRSFGLLNLASIVCQQSFQIGCVGRFQQNVEPFLTGLKSTGLRVSARWCYLL
jgi:hypothetical protein